MRGHALSTTCTIKQERFGNGEEQGYSVEASYITTQWEQEGTRLDWGDGHGLEFEEKAGWSFGMQVCTAHARIEVEK
jgi:hypothetical protein